MTTGEKAGPRRFRSWLFCSLGVLLLAAALWVRWDPGVVAGDGVRIQDPDTLRRLVRLRALDAAQDYPVVEVGDGWPDGSVLHWTLPMDWVIRALDPVARVFVPGAARYEAGAVLAGPVLGALSLAVLLAGAYRLAGAAAALLAGLVYAFSYAAVEIAWLGNGDHQSLQHLTLLIAILLGLIALNERRSGLALASGVAFGLAVWMSTESMLIVYFVVPVLAATAAFERERVPWADRARVLWSAGLVALIAAGHFVEHGGGLWALEYDTVSWLQLWQGLVILGFALLLRVLPLRAWNGTLLAGAIAVALGLVPLSYGPIREVFAAERARLATVDPWLRHEVVEMWGLFAGDGSKVAALLAVESWLIFALPLFLAGVAMLRDLAPAARVALIALAAGTFALEIWEQKLAQFFAMVFPLVVVCGGLPFARRALAVVRARPGWIAYGVTAALLGWAAVTPLPVPPSQRPDAATYADWRALCTTLREEAKKRPPGGVLAPWSLGAMILYHAELPVVASNYHRNIDGIFDSHRLYLTPQGDRDAIWRILRERKVRFVVATYDPLFLKHGALTLGRQPLAEQRPGGFTVSKEGLRTFFFELRDARAISGMRLVAEGRRVPVGGRREPVWRVWAVE